MQLGAVRTGRAVAGFSMGGTTAIRHAAVRPDLFSFAAGFSGGYDLQDVRMRGVVTGKSVSSGGSHGRAEATGQGVVHCITEWAKDKNFNLDGCHVIIQGFGNVGSYAARLLSQKGAVIIGVGDVGGYIANTEGINPHKLGEHVHKTGSVTGYKGASKITREDKAKILGLNAARLYNVDVNAKRNAIPADGISKAKMAYLSQGGQRQNAAYGWVRAND